MEKKVRLPNYTFICQNFYKKFENYIENTHENLKNFLKSVLYRESYMFKGKGKQK